jgi:hypothetical protein
VLNILSVRVAQVAVSSTVGAAAVLVVIAQAHYLFHLVLH